MTSKPAATPSQAKLEEVSITIKLPKPLHAKLVQIGVSEGKSPADKAVQAIREHTAGYERVSKTVTGYAKKKTAK